MRVAENIIHPKYNKKSQDYDVAILRLRTSLQFSDSIQPIPLANSNEILDDGVMCNDQISLFHKENLLFI